MFEQLLSFFSHFNVNSLLEWLSPYAYEPVMIYSIVMGMMLLSGLGLPLPEEVTIVTVGLLSYMGAHPDVYPPPFPGATPINGYEAALFTALAVFTSDFLVFFMGRYFGRRIQSHSRFRSMFSGVIITRVHTFLEKYGVYAAFIFRFTPGIRFPAHLMLGMSPFKVWQFVVVDGFAVLISVPTQILLVYHFGESILKVFKEMKIVLGVVLLVVIAYIGFKKLYLHFRDRKINLIS